MKLLQYYVLYNIMLRFLTFNGRRCGSDFNTIICIYIFSFHYIMYNILLVHDFFRIGLNIWATYSHLVYTYT